MSVFLFFTNLEVYTIIGTVSRPHHALGLDVPCKHYTSSPRTLPERISVWEYDSGCIVRLVRSNGFISFQGQSWEGLVGKHIAIVPSDEDGVWNILFRNFRIAQLDLSERLFRSKKIVRLRFPY